MLTRVGNGSRLDGKDWRGIAVRRTPVVGRLADIARGHCCPLVYFFLDALGSGRDVTWRTMEPSLLICRPDVSAVAAVVVHDGVLAGDVEMSRGERAARGQG